MTLYFNLFFKPCEQLFFFLIRRKTRDSIKLADWSARCLKRGFPSNWRRPNAMWKLRAQRPHTHSAQMVMVKSTAFFVLLLLSLFLVGLQLPLLQTPQGAPSSTPRDPATLIEEPPDYHNIVAKDALGHSHPVDYDVGCYAFSFFTESL